MINYDSILSAFDGKPTLLQWLKMVKKALDESVLKDITVSQDGASAVFTFNFEDGTSISTPAVTLPKGDTGAKGDKGDKGEQGVSVTGVDEVSNEVVGGQTLTTLRFNFSNGASDEVVVHAENGKSGGAKLYTHALSIRLKDRNNNTVQINSLIYSPINTAANNSATLVALLNRQAFPAWGYALNSNYFNPYFIQSLYAENTHFRYKYISPHSVTEFESGDMSETDCTEITISDTVTEL